MDTKFCVKLKSAYHTQIACKLCTIIALFTCSSLVFRLLNIHVRVLVVERLKCVYASRKNHAQLRKICARYTLAMRDYKRINSVKLNQVKPSIGYDQWGMYHKRTLFYAFDKCKLYVADV